jgi:hypothetical protein
MEHCAGIDVSLERSSVCVVDARGKIVKEAKVASEPEAVVAFFETLGIAVKRIGLEAGPLSQWLHAGLKRAGFETVLLETRPYLSSIATLQQTCPTGPSSNERRSLCSPGIAQRAGVGVNLRAGYEFAIELGEQGPLRREEGLRSQRATPKNHSVLIRRATDRRGCGERNSPTAAANGRCLFAPALRTRSAAAGPWC